MRGQAGLLLSHLLALAGIDSVVVAEQLQLSQLRYVSTSRAAATTLAENYSGYPELRGGPSS